MGRRQLGTPVPRPQTGISNFDFLLGLQDRAAQQRSESRLSAERKSAVQAASQKFNQGDFQGAIADLSQVDPAFVGRAAESGFLQQISPAVPPKLQQTIALNPETGKEEIVQLDPTGQAAPKFTGLAPRPQDRTPRSLTDSAQQRLADTAKATRGLERMQALFNGLVEEKKVGPIPGSFEALKNLVGTASPDSTEFQRLREFLALGIAAEQNRGRPTDKDFEAAAGIMSTIQLNPAAGFSQLVSLSSELEQNQANVFLDAIELNPRQANQIRQVAKRRGIDLAEAQRIQQASNKIGIAPGDFRRKIKLLKAFTKNKSLKQVIQQSPDLRDDLIGFADQLDAQGFNPSDFGL